MKGTLIALFVVLVSAQVDYAQSESKPKDPPIADTKTDVGSQQSSSTLQEIRQNLPDNPIPILPSLQDGPFPCPYGDGRSCALLGGRLYFSDPGHMTEHEATWGKAIRNRFMIASFVLNVASTVADIEGTQACIHAGTCREGNPIFGSKPTRARAYGVAMPIAFGTYALAGWMKKHGDGNVAFGILWAGTMAHTYLAASGFGDANKGTTPSANSAQRLQLRMAIRF
jgi:hypothetical protein